jgi:uncharacterized protein YjbI with pentapeptide repeats
MRTRNLTPFLFGTKVTSRRPPQPEMVAIVRGTFTLVPGGVARVPEGRHPLLIQGALTSAVHRGGEDDGQGGACVYPDDFADFKLRADVLLAGTCHTPGGAPIAECPVRFAVGSFSKILRVVGPRVWVDDALGGTSTDPLPFTRMPLDWEHAFGGPGHEGNPVGRGLGTQELPNVEDPRHAVRSRRDRPAPASFLPIAARWPMRARLLGKAYGEAWRRTRAPFHAEDLDWSFFNAAPEDQRVEGYLHGDEPLIFQNLHPTIPVYTSRLPGVRVRVFVREASGRTREAPMVLDTLFADLDAETVTLTWRGLLPVDDDDLHGVRAVLVASEPLADRPLPEARHLADLDAFERDPLRVDERMPEALRPLSKRVLYDRPAPEDLLVPPPDDGVARDPVSALLHRRLGGLAAPEQQQVRDVVERALAQPMPDGVDLRRKLEEALRDPPAPPAVANDAPGGVTIRDARVGKVVRALRETAERLKREAEKEGRTLDGLAAYEAIKDDPRVRALEAAADAPSPAEPGPGADLSGRDLRGADLRGRDLRGAILQQADLRGARLDGARLGRAVLHRARLEGATLDGADLTGASANLVQADGASFAGATLDRAIFERASLRGASFRAAAAAQALFSRADLTEAKLGGARFSKVMLHDATLDRADLAGASLSHCLLVGARAQGADFAGATLDGACFMRADLRAARFSDARGAGAVWTSAQIEGADFGHAVLPRACFLEARAEGAVFHGANLAEGRFYRAELARADLSRSNLAGADLSKAALGAASLAGANLFQARLDQTKLAGCNLDGAVLTRSSLERA